MGCRLSSSRLKGKSPLAMELIADRYRNGWGTPGSCGESAGSSFHEDSLERNYFSGDGVRFPSGRREAARVAYEELDQQTSSRRPAPGPERWCSSR